MSEEISFRHGDHICLFYNDINEQTILTVPFVKVGLRRGERCLCVLTTAQSDRLCSSLRASGIDPQKEVSRGALLFATPERHTLPPANSSGRQWSNFSIMGCKKPSDWGSPDFVGLET
jgi:hypothetical protein